MPTTEIILPVHNGLSLLRDGLDAVLAYTPRGDSRLRVVDDASDPVTAAWLREQAAAHADWITLQRQDENLGFLATCNRAMASPESAQQLSDYLAPPEQRRAGRAGLAGASAGLCGVGPAHRCSQSPQQPRR